jgi:DNA-binding NarL/FixJ family response regulator
VVSGRANDAAPVLIVDPDESARELAADVLCRVGYLTLQAKSGEQAIEMAQRERPRVVVLEVCLPGICGYEVCRELREVFGEGLSIVFVSGTRREPHDRVAGLLLGADDYLTKPFAPDELLARVRRFMRSAAPLAFAVASRLTRREREVLELLAQGLGQKDIASRLCISPKTVGTHLEHIFAKLGVRNKAQAVALAYRDDLVDGGLVHSFAPLILAGADFLLDWPGVCGGMPLPG